MCRVTREKRPQHLLDKCYKNMIKAEVDRHVKSSQAELRPLARLDLSTVFDCYYLPSIYTTASEQRDSQRGIA